MCSYGVGCRCYVILGESFGPWNLRDFSESLRPGQSVGGKKHAKIWFDLGRKRMVWFHSLGLWKPQCRQGF